MEAYLILWGICGVLGGIVGSAKHSAGAGFLLGFLFGPVGVLITLALDGRPKCHACKSRIDPEASVCPQCGASLKRHEQQAAIFHCPNCRRSIAADDSDVMTCPRCRELIPVPAEHRPKRQEQVAVMRKLVACPDCGHQVSRRAKVCPQCGGPMD